MFFGLIDKARYSKRERVCKMNPLAIRDGLEYQL